MVVSLKSRVLCVFVTDVLHSTLLLSVFSTNDIRCGGSELSFVKHPFNKP